MFERLELELEKGLERREWNGMEKRYIYTYWKEYKIIWSQHIVWKH